jgi:formate hydrogenlyase subunit 3/multisubunit Na+/H+ antiporter MnhD subunit
MIDGEIFPYVPWWRFCCRVSFAAGVLLPAGRLQLKRAIHVAGSLASFGLVLSLLPGILGGNVYGMELIPIVEGISIRLTVDTLGYYFGLVLAFLWVLATVYSLGYIKHKDDRYYGFMALCHSFCWVAPSPRTSSPISSSTS